MQPSHGYDLMKHFLAQFERKPQCVLGDGNCLFRALSVQLTGSEENHIAVRKVLVDFEAKNPNIFAKKAQAAKRVFTAHLESMQKVFIWGTDLEIEAAASLFQTEIYEATDSIVPGEGRWLRFMPLTISTLNALHLADSIQPRRARGWLELLYMNKHFDSVQPASSTTKLTKPALETQATHINIV